VRFERPRPTATKTKTKTARERSSVPLPSISLRYGRRPNRPCSHRVPCCTAVGMRKLLIGLSASVLPAGNLRAAGNSPIFAFRHFSSCYTCRAGERPSCWRNLERQMRTVVHQVSSAEVLWGLTSLRAHGLVVRGIAISGRSLAEGLVEIWKTAKWFLCGRVATLPRKVR